MGGGSSKKKKEEEERIKKELKEKEESQKQKQQEEIEKQQQQQQNQQIQQNEQQVEQDQGKKQKVTRFNLTGQYNESSKYDEKQQLKNSNLDDIETLKSHQMKSQKLPVQQQNQKQQQNFYDGDQQLFSNVAREQNQRLKPNDKPLNNLSLNFSKEFKEQPSLQMSQELSPIHSEREETEEEKQQRLVEKIAKFAVLAKMGSSMMDQFSWPKQGQCKIISANFSYEYNVIEQQLRLLKSYDFYTSSRLIWKYDENVKVYDFVLQDEEIYNLNTDIATKLPYNNITFLVNQTGNFIGIKEEQDFVKKLRTVRKQIDLEQKQVERETTKKKKKKEINPEQIIKQTEEVMRK